MQLRELTRKFCDEELAPYADEIDKTNVFPQMKEFWLKLGEMGFLGITAPGTYYILFLSYNVFWSVTISIEWIRDKFR